MSLETIAFYGFAGATALSAILLAFTRQVIHAAFMLFLVLFGVAAMYVFAGAPFLAVTQIIVYVGGILIVILFGVMLTHKFRDMSPRTGTVYLLPAGLLAAALFAALLTIVFTESYPDSRTSFPEGVSVVSGNPEKIGYATMTRYLLPFELVSVLLLAVLIGAAYISRKHFPKSRQDQE